MAATAEQAHGAAGPTRRLRPRHHVGYALGSVGPGVFSTVPGLLLLFYLTDTLGVAPGLAGVVVLVPKIWDVLINPLVGLGSDRRPTRIGYLAAGTVLLPVALALLFATPPIPHGWLPLWVGGAYLLAATGYSLFEVPYVAVPAEITDDYDERTALNGYRMVLLTLGILLSGAAAPALVDAGGGARAGYRLMGVVVALVVLAFSVPCVLVLRRTPVVRRQAASGGLRAQVQQLRTNRPFAVLMAVYFGQALAIGAMLAGAPYFSTYVLGDTSATTVMFVCLVGPALVVMPVWVRVAARLGKRTALVASSVLFAAGALAMAAAPALSHGVVFALAAVLGVAFAGMQMLPYAMLPDTVDAGALDGVGQAGVVAGLWIAGETTGFAIGPALLAWVLQAVGFVATTDGSRVAQTARAVSGVRYGFSVLPAGLLLLTLPLVRYYRVGREATPSGT